MTVIKLVRWDGQHVGETDDELSEIDNNEISEADMMTLHPSHMGISSKLYYGKKKINHPLINAPQLLFKLSRLIV